MHAIYSMGLSPKVDEFRRSKSSRRDGSRYSIHNCYYFKNMALRDSIQLYFNMLVVILFILLYIHDLSLVMQHEGESSNMNLRSSLHRSDLLDGEIGTHSPPNQPSLRISGDAEKKAASMRKGYGGKGDKIHLGGFIPTDQSSRSNGTWNFMMGHLGIKSVLDVGCGVGVSAKYFRDHGARVKCIEGSHDAVSKSLLPSDAVVEHDFTRGAYWPEETFDAAWSVEFVEHVGRQFQKNYFPAFRRAAMIFMTASTSGGHHHSEIRPHWWWKAKMEAAGFIYSDELTEIIRLNAQNDRSPGVPFYGQYIKMNMMVFINQKVASRPEHQHLVSGHGCKWDNALIPCDKRFKWFNSDVDTPSNNHQALLQCEHKREAMAQFNSMAWAGGPWNCKPNPDFRPNNN